MHKLVLHLIDQSDYPFHAATEPIQLPDHECIGFTQVGKGLFKPRALGLGTADLVSKHAFAARFLERVGLDEVPYPPILGMAAAQLSVAYTRKMRVLF